MVLIGPKSVAIGSDRSVRVEKAKRKRAKYKVARLPAATAAVGLELPYKNATPILIFPPYDVVWRVHTICIEDKLGCVRDPAKDFDTGADRERIMNDAVGGNAGEQRFDRVEHRPPRRAAAFLGLVRRSAMRAQRQATVVWRSSTSRWLGFAPFDDCAFDG
jgi:hypothetical protein